MSSVGDRHAELLTQISSLLESERKATLTAQDAERKSILTALDALRSAQPAVMTVQQTGMGFFGGLLIGAAIGTAAVLLLTPLPGVQLRAEIGKRMRAAAEAARKAMAVREQELWAIYRQRVSTNS